MNRRLFLKRFGIGAAAIVAIPMVLGRDQACPAFDHDLINAREYHLNNCRKIYRDSKFFRTSDEWHQWDSLYTAPIEPQVWRELTAKYGKQGFGLFPTSTIT